MGDMGKAKESVRGTFGRPYNLPVTGECLGCESGGIRRDEAF